MKSIVVFLLVIGLPITAIAEEGQEGTKYLNWCSRLADAEKLLGSQRESYIRHCMESLAEADLIPDADNKKDSSAEEDEE